MRQWFKAFWLAIQFFTRWPTPQYEQIGEQDMGRALAWLPLVGLLIGVSLWALSLLQAWLPAEVVALLILLLWVWNTGALHIDGAADFADGWLGGHGDKQRALTIMKDSRIGTGGGVAIGLILLLKWVLLTELLLTGQAWWLVLIPLIARVGSLVLMTTTVYVSENGMAESMFRFLNPQMVWFWLALVALLIFWLQPGLVFVIVAWWWVRWLLMRTLGGINGDGAGLMTEVLEISMVLALLVLFG